VWGLVVLAEYESDLLHLKNLGVASVNILRAVGISNTEDLRQLGAVETYVRIKRRGINVSKVMLYALEGALIDVHWKDLDPSLKEQLVSNAHRILAEEAAT
jgi:DNA transformation protein